MPLSRRYSPEWSPADSATIGMDFSAILPPGVGLMPAADASGPTPRLEVWVNYATPVQTLTDWEIGPVAIAGRIVYAMVSGGLPGVDYQFRWIVNDTDNNRWTRTGLLQCAVTS